MLSEGNSSRAWLELTSWQLLLGCAWGIYCSWSKLDSLFQARKKAPKPKNDVIVCALVIIMKPYFTSALSMSLCFKLISVECVHRHSNGFGFLDLGVFTKRP